MKPIQVPRNARAIAAAILVTSLLAACGGGSDKAGAAATSNVSGSGGASAGNAESSSDPSKTTTESTGGDGASPGSETVATISDGVTTNEEPKEASPVGELVDDVSVWISRHLAAAPEEPPVP